MGKEEKPVSLTAALWRYQSQLMLVGTVSKVLSPFAKIMGSEKQRKRLDAEHKHKLDAWLAEQISKSDEKPHF